MRWRWIETDDGPVLRPDPVPPGVGELGFAGRYQPGKSILSGRASVRLGQVHGQRVVEVSEPGSVSSCDGASTVIPDLLLTVRTADCVPVLLADPSRISLLHAGWRGLAAGILEAGLSGFGDPRGVCVVLGPAIRACCYEVGLAVAALFPEVALRPGRRDRPHLDLFRAATVRLVEAGVPPPAIVEAPFCTRCHQHLLASARGSGGGPERIIAFASHRPETRVHSP
jgi:purine-nucleoside/S-methyl-5'-thioadenosine phosphorylase / adenosine deaminase